VELDDVGQQQVAHAPSGYGARADRLAARRVELVHADEQQVGEVSRQGHLAVVGGADQLLGEECIALRSRDDRADLALWERWLAKPEDELADVWIAEPAELQTLDVRQPHPLGGRRAQGMAAMEVVTAIADGE